ncbi:erythromycin esterase family protein [Hymenobacter yonginensis]|uniref:Erythromycin esterase family protein n=1 Tax=Hymenobacter yonginensis TaxID=748197 RepID=A0ABY7PMY7_9BACT|nr:erythromycin esterase family protein [Hymenobacter yonginensis]WBO84618.1 erythromycin esterase family protein [Hymenobacter yonginensis]
MPVNFRLLAACCLLTAATAPALAQPTTPATTAPAAAPLLTHAIRSINPADTDFSDLEFLRQEIGGARVVMLGEPTHGVGTATEAKIRLIRFLKERMGFTTVAFESGFYALDRAEREIQRGAPVPAAISASVYPVWTQTQEFQAMLPLLGKGGLRVTGFDSQVSWNDDEMLEELEVFLKPEKGADGIAYDYLDECVSMMGEHNIFPPSHQILLFDMQLGKARKLLTKVAAGPDARRRERATFWLQQVRSLQALAHDYATNDPAVKDSAEFKAKDSNARDAQMADNLLWYLRQHPQEKVVCWGAIGHLAGKVIGLEQPELQEFKPMGQTVKAALGPEAVYVLSTLAGGGTHGFGYWGKHQLVPPPASGSLEADLLAQGQDYSFISLKHDAPSRRLTTHAFEFLPVAGPWSEAVDGFLFLKTIEPPHAATGIVADATPAAAETPANQPPGRLGQQNAATQRPVAKTGAAFPLSGVVLDRKTGQPVPFATVAVPARSAGTVTDAQGRFRLEVRRGELVQISSIGYEPATLVAAAGSALQVRLAPAAFALADVRVSAQSQDPKRIMKKVIKAAETNYERQDYTQQAYTRRRAINFDTLRSDVEYTSQLWTPAGYHNWGGGFLMMEPTPIEQVQQKNDLAQVVSATRPATLEEGGHGFAGGFDPVRISPLFKNSMLGKYQLRLDTIEQRDGQSVYVIRFAAKRASHRATGMYLTAGYSGRVYVRQDNYAVVRYEALWQDDTIQNNSIARKYYGRGNTIARLYDRVYTTSRTTHVVMYQQAVNGRYYAAGSIAQAASIGRVLGNSPFHGQLTCEVYFTPPKLVNAAEIPDPKLKGDLGGGGRWQLAKVPYRPEFWQTYQRPVPAEPAPTLEAGK